MSDMLSIDTPDGTFSAYIARPATVPAPAVVVLQEIFGVNPDMRQTADELAALGFIAICPDLFWRQVRNVVLSDKTDWEQGLALYQAYDLELGVRDITATLDAARALPESTGKVGLMGFCLGGLMTFLTAAKTDVDAAVAYYGGNTDQHLAEATTLSAPMIMHLGEEDEFISKEAREAIQEGLRDKANIEVYTYPGCYHAFSRHRGTHYDPAAASLANGQLLQAAPFLGIRKGRQVAESAGPDTAR
jgi:carboxymethylenebutenolidase